MGLWELLLIAVGLSMDAFAVAVGKGLSMKRARFRGALTVGLYFGIFQAAMPLAGYLLGAQFLGQIEALDHWLAFILLAVIGGKMIYESLKHDGAYCVDEPDGLSPRKMLPLALATSIDALAVGISFAVLRVNIIPAVIFIGAITLALSMIGVWAGNVFGMKYQSKAEFVGGLILILIGLKILLEHLGVISF